MSNIIKNAIKTLSDNVNVSTGLNHPNDMNKARDLFRILHEKGEILLKKEIEGEAMSHGWSASAANELGSLAQQIGEGKAARVQGGPWWAADIYDKLQ